MSGEIQPLAWILGSILVAAFLFTMGGLVINGIRQAAAQRRQTEKRKRQWRGEEPMSMGRR